MIDQRKQHNTIRALAAYQRDHGALPNNGDLGKDLGVSRETARQRVADLIASGWLTGEGGNATGWTDTGIKLARDLLATPPVAKPVETAVAVAQSNTPAPVVQQKKSLLKEVASGLNIEESVLIQLLKTQIISTRSNEPPPTNEEMAIVCHTMHKYGLDPMLKEVHAFRSQGKLSVMVGIDGWIRQCQRRPGYLGATYTYSETTIDLMVAGKKRSVPEWIECKLESKDRIPTTYRAYMEEWYVPSSPNWQKSPVHRLQGKAYSQAARMHYGIALADEVDYENMQMMEQMETNGHVEEGTAQRRAQLAADMAAKPAATEDRLRAARERQREALQQKAEDAEVVDEPAAAQPEPEDDHAEGDSLPADEQEVVVTDNGDGGGFDPASDLFGGQP